MKMNIKLALIIAAVLPLAACGGGGGGGGAGTTPNTGAAPTRAVVKLSVAGTAAQIGGVDATVSLPAGVTARSTAAPPETDAGVVVATGAAATDSIVIATYNAPAVRVVLASSGSNGFSAGEYATITCDLASGARPAASDFAVSAATVGDLNGAPVTGAIVTVAVTLE